MDDAATSPTPPSVPAIESRKTGRALRGYALRSAGIAVMGIVLCGVLGGLAPAAGVAGLAVAAAGLLCLVNALRMRWMLRRPWRAWPARYRVLKGGAAGSPTFLLRGEGGEEHVLAAVAFRWRWRSYLQCDGSEVWLAGDPARGGVASTPGGAQLVWVRRPLSTGWRESLLRRMREGDAGAAAPAPDQLDQPG